MHLIDLLVACSKWACHTTLGVLPAMALLVLLGRWRAFPARWRMVLAAVIALRLLMPVVPAVPWHPWSKGKVPVTAVERASAHAEQPAIIASATTPTLLPIEATPWALTEVLAIVWLLGVGFTVTWVLASHWSLRSLIHTRSRPANDEVASTLLWSRKRMGLRDPVTILQVKGLPTMALWGWLAPRVLVPHDAAERYSKAELRGMLLHELAHLRRRDGLWIWFALAACALHWFNPLVWLSLRRYLADRELECDRTALDHLPETDRLTYGHALLKTLANHHGWSFATCTPFARSTPTTELKHRITMIAQPLNSRWGRIAALLTIPLLALGTLTTAADELGKKKPTAEGDGAAKKGPRDGEGGAKKGPRDGEGKKPGAREGEGVAKKGPRDGEGAAKKGPRDGEGSAKRGPRDGEGKPSAERSRTAKATSETGAAIVLELNADGDVVSSTGEVIPLKRLRGHLKSIADANADQAIIVRSASDGQHRQFLDLLDALKDVGLKNVQQN